MFSTAYVIKIVLFFYSMGWLNLFLQQFLFFLTRLKFKEKNRLNLWAVSNQNMFHWEEKRLTQTAWRPSKLQQTPRGGELPY